MFRDQPRPELTLPLRPRRQGQLDQVLAPRPTQYLDHCRRTRVELPLYLAVVVADRRIMGDIRRGQLTFVLDERWSSMDATHPLPLSMPLVGAEHEHARIYPWLWGLLPDNEAILARWGRRINLSPRNIFALLSVVGKDCADHQEHLA